MADLLQRTAFALMATAPPGKWTFTGRCTSRLMLAMHPPVSAEDGIRRAFTVTYTATSSPWCGAVIVTF